MENVKIKIRKDEEKIVPFMVLDSEKTDIDVDVKLTGRRGKITLLGLFLQKAYQRVNLKINIVHKAPDTMSRVDIRAVLFDHADFNNDGLIRIEQGAKRADSFYNSKVLLFDEAKGRSVPSLEIDENEVKAGHASSVGRPSDLELFYLESRGLSKKMAEKLLISGFLSPILQGLPEEQRRGIQEKLFLRFGT